jgi:hypothetical protein
VRERKFSCNRQNLSLVCEFSKSGQVFKGIRCDSPEARVDCAEKNDQRSIITFLFVISPLKITYIDTPLDNDLFGGRFAIIKRYAFKATNSWPGQL